MTVLRIALAAVGSLLVCAVVALFAAGRAIERKIRDVARRGD